MVAPPRLLVLLLRQQQCVRGSLSSWTTCRMQQHYRHRRTRGRAPLVDMLLQARLCHKPTIFRELPGSTF